MELNRVYKYNAHTLIPQNTESDEPELKNVGEELQDKNELICHNTIIVQLQYILL